MSAPGPPTFKCADGCDGRGTDFESMRRKYKARLAVMGPLTLKSSVAMDGRPLGRGEWLLRREEEEGEDDERLDGAGELGSRILPRSSDDALWVGMGVEISKNPK